MHVVENPNFPSPRFDPTADLFFAICAPEKSRRQPKAAFGAFRGYSPPSKIFFDM
jgi:hypothetical protein